MSELYHFSELAEYVDGRLADLQVMQAQLARTQHLKTKLNQDWIKQIAGLVRTMGPDLRCTDPAYYLFCILHDETGRSNLIERLDHAIGTLENLARNTGRLKPFREGLHKLRNPQANEIRGAIFEFLALDLLIKLASDSGLEIEVYPTLPNGRNIEGRALFTSRWCNFDAKALGFSEHDVVERLNGVRQEY